jgi:hypothetical protein
LGFKVKGKVSPETVKPVPATVAALTVTAAVPVEESVNVCVAAVFTLTLPNDKLVLLRLNVIAAGSSSRPAVWVTPVELAVKVTACATFTAETVAEKLPLVAPTAREIEAGTVTAGLLLPRFTVSPPVGHAAFVVTVQLSVPAPVIVPLVQLSALSLGTPLPPSLILFKALSAELLVRSSSPVAAPVTVGSNCSERVAV